MNVKGKVLVVDDQPSTRELFAIVLEKLGYDFMLADNGKDALEKIKKETPAIIFMDLYMPVLDGYETVTQLRKTGYKNPIIAVTGRTDENIRGNCLETGMNDVLIKPFKQADIKSMFNKWLNNNDTNGPAEEANTSSPAKNYIFDAADVLDTFMNNEKTVKSLLSRFLERTKEQLEKFPVLEKTGEWDIAKKEAHLIKGSAATLAGSELGNAAALLEQAAIKAAPDEFKTSCSALNEAFERFKNEAEKFISARS